MAHKAIVPATGEVRRTPFVRHDRFLEDRYTGVVEVRWRIDPDNPVVIGAGWYQLYKPPAARLRRPGRPGAGVQKAEVVADIVRRGAAGLPVLPGSSLKGAVRQVYELLTGSCRPAVRGSCKVRPKDPQPQICPACSLFGAPGLGGRLSIGEARPADDRVRVEMIGVPTAWRPRKERRGALKVYDQREAVDPRTRQKQKKNEATWSVDGDFRSRIRFVNASREELGLFFGALGFTAPGGSRPSPMLRVGGKKFDGLGAVDVDLVEVRWRYPERSRLKAAEAGRWAAELVAAAVFGNADRERAWKALHQALSAGG